jgi:hypothetical protein
MSWL